MMKQPMLKMAGAMLACALLTTLTVVDAQDSKEENAKTQGDISRERAKACEGLRDAALHECLDNYVGPARDATTSEEQGSSAKTEQHKSGDEGNQNGEHEDASRADMSKAKKRAPVGPTRSAPAEKQKQD